MLLPGAKPIHSRTFVLLATLVFVIGAVSSVYTYISIDRAGRENIKDRAATMAQMLPKDEMLSLKGSEEDVVDPSYQFIKTLLMDVRRVNSDVRFVYLIGQRSGELFFFVDSEDSESEDYSPPGQSYEEAPWQMQALFKDGVARSDGPTRDRWGVWISGYAPVYGSNGEVYALLGIDLPAEAFILNALAYAALPLLASLLIVALLLASQRVRAKEERALEQRAEFLSIASHEIRTPLTGVRWALEDVLSTDGLAPTSAKETLIKVHDVSRRLVERVNNLLDVTKLEQKGIFKKTQVSMKVLIDEVAKNFALSANQKKVTIAQLVPNDVVVSTDENIMRHVFFNLISNAIKYTKDGTEIRITYEKTSKGHEFSVEDQGEGIPEQDRKNIFRGYHRAQTHEHAGIEGTGLGLYLVEKAIRLAGGSVSLSDAERGGSRFTVVLP